MAYSNANYKKKNAQSMRRNNDRSRDNRSWDNGRDFRKNPNSAGQKFPTGFCSPYNFVPLWEGVYKRYSSPENLPHHDEFQLCTGTIACTFTAKTPVCVSDGKKDEHSDFFRDAEGNYVLSGSTLKGLVRTNMMILGFGAMRPGEDFDDVRMLYRMVGNAKASVKKAAQEDYKKRLCLKDNLPRVSACYVRKNGDEYDIYRAGKFFRVSRRIVPDQNKERYHQLINREKAQKKGRLYPPEMSRIKEENHLMIPNPVLCGNPWLEDDTMEWPVWYQTAIVTVSRYAKGRMIIIKEEQAQEIQPRKEDESVLREGWQAGTLVSPGKIKYHNTLYLFPAFDAKENAEKEANHFRWPTEDRLIYEMDYHQRLNSLGGTDVADMCTKERRKEFWKLPEKDGEAKPFFLLGDWGETIRALSGKDEHNPVVVGRNPYLRIPFLRSPGNGVPSEHRKASEMLVLDYPYALLGFSSTVNGQDKKENLAYRSRVSFGDFHTKAKMSETVKKERVLAGPKPTSFPDYLLDGKNYNEKVFQLRGIKQYWLHPVNNEPKDPKQRDLDAKKKENVTSSLVTLPAGTTFTGHIRFHNLDKDELGLLLWCLTLGKPWDLTEEQPYFQTVGKGKPYGFGRMSVSIDRIELLHPEQLYSSDSLHGMAIEHLEQEHLKTFVAQRITDYVQHIQSMHLSGASLKDQPSIADFLYMHSCIRNQKQVEYTVLSEYRNRVMLLQTVEEQRKALNRSGQAE